MGVIPPFAVTLLEDVPELAARRGDVIVVRPDLPSSAVILWRRLDGKETNRLLAGPMAHVAFTPACPSPPAHRAPLRLHPRPPRPGRGRRPESPQPPTALPVGDQSP